METIKRCKITLLPIALAYAACAVLILANKHCINVFC